MITRLLLTYHIRPQYLLYNSQDHVQFEQVLILYFGHGIYV
jgi:hypothetical protein